MLRQWSTPFDAIAHPVRRMILECLLEDDARPRSITEVAADIEVSRSTASRHFVILRASGLVAASPAKPAVLHAIRPEGFVALDEWLWPFLEVDAPA